MSERDRSPEIKINKFIVFYLRSYSRTTGARKPQPSYFGI